MYVIDTGTDVQYIYHSIYANYSHITLHYILYICTHVCYRHRCIYVRTYVRTYVRMFTVYSTHLPGVAHVVV